MITCFRLAACAIVLTAASLAAQTLPKPAGRITDLANVIDAATEAEMDRQLDQLEQKTSSEIAVVTVPSLDGVPVEDYAVRLFKEWGIGQAKSDNGVLVLVAPNEREMRIEVGYGLEGILPDGLAGQIIRDEFIPRFRDNDYNGGIRDGSGGKGKGSGGGWVMGGGSSSGSSSSSSSGGSSSSFGGGSSGGGGASGRW